MSILQPSPKIKVYDPEVNFSALYRFHVIVKNEEETISTNDNHYIRKVKIKCLGKIGKSFVYQLLTLENEMIGLFDQLLMRKLCSVFDELLIRVDENGSIIEVLNIQNLKIRWETVKAELVQIFKGKVFDNYIRQLDRDLYNKELLHSFLEEKKMFGLFFNGIWTLETNENSKSKNILIKNNNQTNETYRYQNNLLIEANQTNNQTNHNVLCLGLEKIP